MKIKNYTARDLAIAVQASAEKTQKAFVCGEYPTPVVVLEGNSFKTGKHGSSKTRLFCLDYFKNQKISLLVSSDELFIEMKDSPSYKEEEVLLLEATPKGFKYMNSDFNTQELEISEEDREKLAITEGIEEGRLYLLQQFDTSEEVLKKLKILSSN